MSPHALKLIEQLRQAMLAAEDMVLSRPYQVWLTNADLEQIECVHTGKGRDIAESIMVKLFKSGCCTEDYMLWQTGGQEPVALLFSARTQYLRGECSQ